MNGYSQMPTQGFPPSNPLNQAQPKTSLQVDTNAASIEDSFDRPMTPAEKFLQRSESRSSIQPSYQQNPQNSSNLPPFNDRSQISAQQYNVQNVNYQQMQYSQQQSALGSQINTAPQTQQPTSQYNSLNNAFMSAGAGQTQTGFKQSAPNQQPTPNVANIGSASQNVFSSAFNASSSGEQKDTACFNPPLQNTQQQFSPQQQSLSQQNLPVQNYTAYQKSVLGYQEASTINQQSPFNDNNQSQYTQQSTFQAAMSHNQQISGFTNQPNSFQPNLTSQRPQDPYGSMTNDSQNINSLVNDSLIHQAINPEHYSQQEMKVESYFTGEFNLELIQMTKKDLEPFAKQLNQVRQEVNLEFATSDMQRQINKEILFKFIQTAEDQHLAGVIIGIFMPKSKDNKIMIKQSSINIDQILRYFRENRPSVKRTIQDSQSLSSQDFQEQLQYLEQRYQSFNTIVEIIDKKMNEVLAKQSNQNQTPPTQIPMMNHPGGYPQQISQPRQDTRHVIPQTNPWYQPPAQNQPQKPPSEALISTDEMRTQEAILEKIRQDNQKLQSDRLIAQQLAQEKAQNNDPSSIMTDRLLAEKLAFEKPGQQDPIDVQRDHLLAYELAKDNQPKQNVADIERDIQLAQKVAAEQEQQQIANDFANQQKNQMNAARDYQLAGGQPVLQRNPNTWPPQQNQGQNNSIQELAAKHNMTPEQIITILKQAQPQSQPQD